MLNTLLQILDDNHGEFKYGGEGQWTISSLVQWYQGTSNYPAFASSTAFGTFLLSFEGTSIAFIGNTPDNTSSQVAAVSIDDGTPYNITYESIPPPQAYVQWYQSPTLPEGTHTIVVEHLDGTAIDYALIQVGQNTLLNGKTLVIDNDDPTIQFSGKWQRNTDQFNAGSLPDGLPLHNSTHRSSNPGDTFAFGFAGTSVAIYGILNWDNLGSLSATYTLDGITVTQSYPITTTSPEYMTQDREASNFLYFSLDNLSTDVHTLIVTITECQNSQYIFDYVTYTPSFSTLADMPVIVPVSPSPLSSTSSPSSPSQNSPSSPSGPNNIAPTSADSSNPSQSSGSLSGSSGSESTNSSPSSNFGIRVGVIVGGVVGGLLFLVLVAFLIWKRRSQTPSRQFSSDGTISPFQDPVEATPHGFISASIVDVKHQRADPSSNMSSLGISSVGAPHISTSPRAANATLASATMDLEYMQDEGEPPAYDDTAHRRNTFHSL